MYTFTKLHDRRISNVGVSVRDGVGPVEFQLYRPLSIASVYPYIRFPLSYLLNSLIFVPDFLMCMGHDHSLQWIEIRGYESSSRVKDKVMARRDAWLGRGQRQRRSLARVGVVTRDRSDLDP